MFSLKIKQAQFALNQSRLEDAFEIVNDRQVLEHRLGKQLADKLGRKFIERAGGHIQAGTIEQAIADCSKAARLLGNTVEVSQLRKAAAEAIEQRQFAHKQQLEKVAAAQENIRAGWVSVGRDMLAGENPAQAAALLQNAEVIKAKTKAVVSKAEQAIKDGYIEEAIEIIRRGGCGNNIELLSSGIIAKIRADVCKKVRDDLNIGRVDLAERTLELLDSIEAQSLESAELKSIVAECRTACGYIASGQLGLAAELFGKLKIAMPKAKWIGEASNEATKGAKAIDELRAGPLGLLRSRYSSNTERAEHDKIIEKTFEKSNNATVNHTERNKAMTSGMQSIFMLHIDGVGSYIVNTNDHVSVGPVSSDKSCDVKIVAAPDTPITNIERSEGDYFIKAGAPIGINGKTTTGCLLRDGDKVAMSNRTMMKFRKPNSASNTAELIPSGARLIQAGVTSVILMDREILIGAGGSNHIRTDDVKDGAMLFIKDGCLVCKSTETIEVDGRAYSGQCVIEVDKQVRVGDMTMVVTAE